ncbi:PrcB C-terminal [Desulfonispora thiosulfatigenes DSM 11270]|uniref:PrcB C-terminal n=1 Tax=Desulfonispora thiosulfatigenes DSM 11270 TaxID=656914 RepID=A0A1W1V7R3_DESTI|nr:GerMN domain-containing protein [Desulfonispora thiosulfatigenes]SMB89306.1 PrcB C-terminal [Desulfonispora thiosulfatigenes DSM 11270]
MKRKTLLFVILVLTAITVGCASNAQVTEVAVSKEEIIQMPEPILKELEELKSKETYQAFDMGGEILLFVSLGEKQSDGYEVKLERAGIKDDKLYVQVNKKEPTSKPEAEVVTYPTALGKVSGDALPRQIVFIDGTDYTKVIEEVSVSPVLGEQESIINLYFASTEGNLKNETRSFSSFPNATKGTEVLAELLKGPQKQNGLKSIIPEGTKVLNYEYAGSTGIATVDLSKDISKVSGSKDESLVVYSIVNTLTELPGIEKVKFLIEGNEVETLAGNISLKDPIDRNAELLHDNTLK